MFLPWLVGKLIDVHKPVGPVSFFFLWPVGQPAGLIDVHTPVGPVNVFSLACRPT
jgi:hypothetical protein